MDLPDRRLQALGIAFVSLAEGIDATTPAGKLQMHILGAIAEFERERIRERVLAGCSGPGRRGNDSVGRRSVPRSNGSSASPDCRRTLPASGWASHGPPSSAGAGSFHKTLAQPPV